MKTKVDKLDTGKLESTPVDLSKLSNAVKMMLLKRLNMMDWLKKIIILLLPIIVV